MMDQITKFIKDPAWWFTTVFVAIISSVIAAYLKDQIQNLIGHLSSKYRDRLKEKKKLLDLELHYLVEEPDYLILAFIRLTFMFVGMVALMLMYTMSSLLFIVYVKQDVVSASVKATLGFLAATSSVASIFSMFTVLPRLKVLKKAFYTYKQKIKNK
jgi:hypothetical protein